MKTGRKADNKPKWTPGPWTAERANVGDAHPLFVRCNLDSAFRPPCDADAHLIAAAPELYDALEGFAKSQGYTFDKKTHHFVGDLGPIGMPHTAEWCEACRIVAALAKARGEQ